MSKNRLLLTFGWGCFLGFTSCREPEPADLLIYNAKVYTADMDSTVVEAFAIKDGKFLEVGGSSFIRTKYKARRELDLKGKPVYPGFIDAHAHFVGYAQNLMQADLVGTKSFAEVVQRLVAHRKKYPAAPWLLGRGWDQNDWPVKDFPTNDTLNQLFPELPVLITRIDGHAALVNAKALALAQVTPATTVSGGIIQKVNGRLTGILIDNAEELVARKIPPMQTSELAKVLLAAQEKCFAVGLTSVVDAGLEKPVIDLIDSLQKAKALKMRIYAMLSPSEENKNYYFKNGPYHSPYLNVRSFKVYADGALGSRGACLLHPYHDQPNQTGFLLQNQEYYRQLAKQLNQLGFQMNTHAIGDSANRLMLNIYGEVLKGKNNKRWRIEHAQVVNPTDVPKFGRYNIIPSVQPTHATSDMYWAADRLGPERIAHAYAYKYLLKQNGFLALGSDFPVEAINPLYGFHAAVARQDAKNYPAGGFQKNNALTRVQALYGMTRWAAYANFEEKEKGSIERNKYADFVILSQDIITADLSAIRNTKVLATYPNGEVVYQPK
ncbi:amidohydrolase [Adhaeribacter rhizoryzae]|uniref:Amidohydrolase n=1 Tax=Adhaeribacter rhizoryzae TaxID=2607907 RepID=A0A5M6DF61_9BACT|nr:amidohydrolase [Adhaeribacter rhizoryzae]KAA5544819.1 amidohydrolase [Adhaeribacter rhizoryzae]